MNQRSFVNTGDINPEIAYRRIQTKEEKNYGLQSKSRHCFTVIVMQISYTSLINIRNRS